MDVPGGATCSAGTLRASPALLAGASEQQLGGTTSSYVNWPRAVVHSGFRTSLSADTCQAFVCAGVCCGRAGEFAERHPTC